MAGYNAETIIRELANTVIELRAAQFISQGTSADLARVGATFEVEAYLKSKGFRIEEHPRISGERSIRITGGLSGKPID
jgi:hypothetical protein